MKSWKTRLGLVLAMLAMVLAVSVPAMADIDGVEDLEDEFEEVVENDLDAQGLEFDDITCAIDDEDDDDDLWNDIEDWDDDNDLTEDLEDAWNDVTCTADFEVEELAVSDALLAEQFDIDDDDDDDDE